MTLSLGNFWIQCEQCGYEVGPYYTYDQVSYIWSEIGGSHEEDGYFCRTACEKEFRSRWRQGKSN